MAVAVSFGRPRISHRLRWTATEKASDSLSVVLKRCNSETNEELVSANILGRTGLTMEMLLTPVFVKRNAGTHFPTMEIFQGVHETSRFRVKKSGSASL